MFSSNGTQVSGPTTFVEDVFSTYIYTGTGATQTITNNIDLSTYGGLVWPKSRTVNRAAQLIDSARGVNKVLNPNNVDPQQTIASTISSFNLTGFTLGGGDGNNSGENYVTWTFRKQPKFFDVLTYTGTGSNTTIAHSLGAVPGSIIVKRTDAGAAWAVYHRSLANTQYLVLNSTAAAATGATWWNSTTPTSTVFSLGTDASVNASGGTYVAYLFAHDAGGFGLAGTDNVISCGSFTTDGSGNATVSLGYEPQWVMYKSSSTSGGDWQIFDSMRGLTMGLDSSLSANSSGAETTSIDWLTPSATGFSTVGAVFYASATYIYIAMRRGPMKVPTLGTSVYNAIARTGTGAAANVTGVGFSPDLVITGHRTNPTYGFNKPAVDRLRGAKTKIYVDATALEGVTTDSFLSFNMDGFSLGADGSEGNWNENSATLINWNFRRAPGFFDEVCYTGTGATNAVNHNLAAPPEMIIVKGRNFTVGWTVGTNLQATQITLGLNSTSAENNPINNKYYFGNGTITVAPSATQFTVLTADINQNGNTFVAYLFATLAGVSKVFSYTGNGSSQTINCGFTAGSRFVMIKRTDSTGDWYVWDSARGIVAGNDPHLNLNDATAEVTTDDSVDTDNTGFIVNQVAATNVNVSSATYIGLAVA